MRRIVNAFVGIVTAILGAAIAVLTIGRRRLLAEVARDLRHPLVGLLLPIRSRAALRIARRLVSVRTVPRSTVSVREDHVVVAGRPAIRVVVYEPERRARPSGALLWIHGGGLMMGAPEQYHDVCSRFADELGIVVASVDYRLAPEHPFPAGLDDCMASLRWLHENADSMGIDPTRIAVGGDSAGGGLAACIAQRAHDEGGPAICFQLLQYPMLDDRTGLGDSRRALVWSGPSNSFAWSIYLGHEVSDHEPRAYASAARRNGLAGLPPAWIGIGSIDLFHDEAVEYARRLRADGVPCELHVVDGMYHAAERIRPGATSMREFTADMVAALGAAVSVGGDHSA